MYNVYSVIGTFGCSEELKQYHTLVVFDLYVSDKFLNSQVFTVITLCNCQEQKLNFLIDYTKETLYTKLGVVVIINALMILFSILASHVKLRYSNLC